MIPHFGPVSGANFSPLLGAGLRSQAAKTEEAEADDQQKQDCALYMLLKLFSRYLFVEFDYLGKL